VKWRREKNKNFITSNPSNQRHTKSMVNALNYCSLTHIFAIIVFACLRSLVVHKRSAFFGEYFGMCLRVELRARTAEERGAEEEAQQ